jgi:hypothetical protein
VAAPDRRQPRHRSRPRTRAARRDRARARSPAARARARRSGRGVLGAIAQLPPEQRAWCRAAAPARVHAGRDRGHARLAARNVNSRLRRGLDDAREAPVRAELERVEIPAAAEAEAARRPAWSRGPSRSGNRARGDAARPIAPSRRRGRPLAAVLSPPGRAFVDRAPGRRHRGLAARALLRACSRTRSSSAPTPDVWIAQADGSRRLLGDYGERRGRRSAATSCAHARERARRARPEGHVRWTLARPERRFPAWSGTATDTRIAYLSAGRVRRRRGRRDGRRPVGERRLPTSRPRGVPARGSSRLCGSPTRRGGAPAREGRQAVGTAASGHRAVARVVGRRYTAARACGRPVSILDADSGRPLGGRLRRRTSVAIAYRPDSDSFAELHLSSWAAG